MRLPNNEIGISDILAWRDCPRRMLLGMRRHSERGELPESWSPANAYGSAIHHCIQRLEEGDSEQEAIQSAFMIWAKWLDPSDTQQLYQDLETYVLRDILGVRTVISEQDARVPLFVHPELGQIYFRFRLDRLYQRLDDETAFVHVDYKSSKWAKSEKEVDEDLQLWSYNFGIYELYPEATSLVQVYDQLLYGQISTRKSDNQRAQIKDWLITAVNAVIDDEEMKPEFNEWCPWCSWKYDCPVVQHDLSDFARARIAALMPREPKLKKDGSESKVLAPWIPDPEQIDTYVELLPDVATARKTLEDFEGKVRDVMKQMPSSDIERLGYERKTRTPKSASAEDLRAIYEEVGPAEFFHIASVSKAAIERFYADDKEKVAELVSHFSAAGGYDVIEPRRDS